MFRGDSREARLGGDQGAEIAHVVLDSLRAHVRNSSYGTTATRSPSSGSPEAVRLDGASNP